MLFQAVHHINLSRMLILFRSYRESGEASFGACWSRGFSRSATGKNRLKPRLHSPDTTPFHLIAHMSLLFLLAFILLAFILHLLRHFL